MCLGANHIRQLFLYVSYRFGSEHLTLEGYNIVDKEKFIPDRKPSSFNNLDKELQNDLRKYKYDFSKSEKICTDLKAKLSKDGNIRRSILILKFIGQSCR
jgi:hypothetical protein